MLLEGVHLMRQCSERDQTSRGRQELYCLVHDATLQQVPRDFPRAATGSRNRPALQPSPAYSTNPGVEDDSAVHVDAARYV